MKKSLLALAALAASGAAMAQSSVTLYGVIDTGIAYVNGAENLYGLTEEGGNVKNRLGFRGTEDLGNGLKATFNLEAGFAADTGAGKQGGTLAFNRTSTIGLEGAFGTVRLGKMQNSSYVAMNRYDAFADTGIGGSRAWSGDYSAAIRPGNTVSFTTANYSGFKVGVDYGFGEQQKARDSRYFGLAATYDNGPLSVAAAYDRLNSNTVNGVFAADDLKTWQLGGAYNFGVAKVLAFYKDSKVTQNDEKFKTFGLGVTAPVGAAGEVRAAYNHYRLSDNVVGSETLKANQLSLGYVHNLSKRTALYGTYAYLKNKDSNGANMGLTLNSDFARNNLKANGSQHGLQVGVRHAF